MTQVVIRGESVYECDVCTRKVRVPTNRHGLDVVQRCTITSGCQGKLHRVTSSKEIHKTPAFSPEVEGVQDWFARNIFYTHTQTVRASTWTIKHNLQNIPVLHTFVYRNVGDSSVLVDHIPDEVITVDANTTVVKFASAESGQIQCISPSSKNTINFDGLAPVVVPQDAIQISSDGGEITLATLLSAATVNIVLTFPGVAPINVAYSDIDAVPSVNSAWVGASKVIVNGRQYSVRSFSLTSAPEFVSGMVASGAAFYISTINGTPIRTNDVLFLLSGTPHANVDRIYNKYVDAKAVSPTLPEIYYGEGKAHVLPSIVKPTYPLILVV